KASNQDGMAEFNGHVVVGQGDLRISADRIVVEYTPEADNTPSTINLIRATGNVTLVSGSDAAEAQSAVYELETSRVIMTGGVLLTSGTNSVSGGRLTISLKTGSASIEGRVKTVFQPGKPTK
ncbi:MAG: LptA/OstA family protein, partial [Paracoccaceae bacterium]